MEAVHRLAYLVDSCIVNALLVEGAIDPGRDLHNVHEEGGLCVCGWLCDVVFVVATLRFTVLNICRKVLIGSRPAAGCHLGVFSFDFLHNRLAA